MTGPISTERVIDLDWQEVDSDPRFIALMLNRGMNAVDLRKARRRYAVGGYILLIAVCCLLGWAMADADNRLLPALLVVIPFTLHAFYRFWRAWQIAERRLGGVFAFLGRPTAWFPEVL